MNFNIEWDRAEEQFPYQNFSEALLNELSIEITKRTGLKPREGCFSGCFGRLIGPPEIAASINLVAEETTDPMTMSVGIGCWEAPVNRFIFFRRPVTPQAQENLKIMTLALRDILEVDERVGPTTWMDRQTWCKGEQGEDSKPDNASS